MDEESSVIPFLAEYRDIYLDGRGAAREAADRKSEIALVNEWTDLASAVIKQQVGAELDAVAMWLYYFCPEIKVAMLAEWLEIGAREVPERVGSVVLRFQCGRCGGKAERGYSTRTSLQKDIEKHPVIPKPLCDACEADFSNHMRQLYFDSLSYLLVYVQAHPDEWVKGYFLRHASNPNLLDFISREDVLKLIAERA